MNFLPLCQRISKRGSAAALAIPLNARRCNLLQQKEEKAARPWSSKLLSSWTDSAACRRGGCISPALALLLGTLLSVCMKVSLSSCVGGSGNCHLCISLTYLFVIVPIHYLLTTLYFTVLDFDLCTGKNLKEFLCWVIFGHIFMTLIDFV